MKRLQGSRVYTSAHCHIASRRDSDGDQPPRSEIGFQTIQSYPYRARLEAHQPTRLPLTTAFSACCGPLTPFRGESKPVTQELSSQFLLAAPGIPSCATRRTLSAGRRSRIYPYETLRTCRCPSVPYQAPCLSLTGESVPAVSSSGSFPHFTIPNVSSGVITFCVE